MKKRGPRAVRTAPKLNPINRAPATTAQPPSPAATTATPAPAAPPAAAPPAPGALVPAGASAPAPSPAEDLAQKKRQAARLARMYVTGLHRKLRAAGGIGLDEEDALDVYECAEDCAMSLPALNKWIALFLATGGASIAGLSPLADVQALKRDFKPKTTSELRELIKRELAA